MLQLVSSKFYVGKTQNIVRRFEEHLEGKASKWTSKYQALSIVKLVEDEEDDFQEIRLTLKYMMKYGIENVRGGPFCHIEMSDADRQIVERMFRSNSFPKPWGTAQTTELRAGTRWTKEDDAKFIEAIKRGDSPSFMAKTFGRSDASIHARTKTIICRMASVGKSVGDISRELNLTEERVRAEVEGDDDWQKMNELQLSRVSIERTECASPQTVLDNLRKLSHVSSLTHTVDENNINISLHSTLWKFDSANYETSKKLLLSACCTTKRPRVEERLRVEDIDDAFTS